MHYIAPAAALLSVAALASAQQQALYSRSHEVYARNPAAASIDPNNFISAQDLYARMASPEPEYNIPPSVLRARQIQLLRRSIPAKRGLKRRAGGKGTSSNRRPAQTQQRPAQQQQRPVQQQQPRKRPINFQPNINVGDINVGGIATGVAGVAGQFAPAQAPPVEGLQARAPRKRKGGKKGGKKHRKNRKGKGGKGKGGPPQPGAGAEAGADAAGQAAGAAAGAAGGEAPPAEAPPAEAAAAPAPAAKIRRNALAIGSRSAAPVEGTEQPGFFAKIARSLGF